VGVGGRDEDPDESGISHFLEHLLFKGTTSRTARQVDEAIDGVGGEMNAYTGREVTAFYVRVPQTDAAEAMDLLADVLTSPSLHPDDVEIERGVILEEYAMRDDDPADLAGSALAEALFPGHGLGRDVIGDHDVLQRVTSDEIRAFFERHYGAPCFAVSAAGAIDHHVVEEWAGTRLDLSRPDAAPPIRSAPSAPSERIKVVTRDTAQVQLAHGVLTFGVDDPDRYSLAVLNHVLGGGYASRLFDEVRERRGLAYSVASVLSFHSQGGTLSVHAGTSPTRAAETIKVISREIERMATGGITDRELELAKGFVAGDAVLSSEDTGSRMARLAHLLVAHDDVWSIDAQVERYRSVDIADVTRAAERVLAGSWSTAVVGPITQEEATAWL